MAEDDTNYRHEAIDDAANMAEEFLDQILEQIEDKGEASDDLNNDYSGGDEYHHQSNVDKSYRLLEAAQVLDQLSEFEETDSGLWEGLAPREAVEAQAAYTYGAAVYSLWTDLIKEINEKVKEESFAEGPKDWSPIKKNKTLKEFIKKVIQEWRE
jgi:hypothetical protein